MSGYSGRMWLLSDRGFKLRVEIQFETDAIKVLLDESPIADWNLSDVIVRSVKTTAVHLRVEGEEVIISSRDPDFMPEFVRIVDGYRASHEAQSHLPLAAGDDGISSFARDVGPAWPQSNAASKGLSGVPASDRHAAVGTETHGERGTHRSSGPMLWKW